MDEGDEDDSDEVEEQGSFFGKSARARALFTWNVSEDDGEESGGNEDEDEVDVEVDVEGDISMADWGYMDL